jgi:uncharacterized protein YecA (UPF0149 family)
MNSNDVIDQLAAEISICYKCSERGNLVCSEDVAEHVQKEANMDENVVYLHCTNCNEYIPVMGISMEEGFQKTKNAGPATNSTSRNAICPCGSGRKFKRCCGKN